ncbi:hypothetical protein BDV95DRAFT_623926 [Massariosphaeria phaeospora]|uniref:Uncharacterized protein n=1 Tax=Massariosphaeria phaeospora TaxID=100035 RepID=A0A7C8I178_9PLEO|nr:hypothetical protein BDV95DRAFT_623926 [Massariosphaeria phaeospora]
MGSMHPPPSYRPPIRRQKDRLVEDLSSSSEEEPPPPPPPTNPRKRTAHSPPPGDPRLAQSAQAKHAGVGATKPPPPITAGRSVTSSAAGPKAGDTGNKDTVRPPGTPATASHNVRGRLTMTAELRRQLMTPAKTDQQGKKH